MDFVWQILLAGAAAAGKETVSQAVKDAYQRLKSLVTRRDSSGELEGALERVESGPNADAPRLELREALRSSGLERDEEVLRRAEELRSLISISDRSVSGSGSIASGPGAVSAGEGGVAVGGDVHGGIRLGGGDERRRSGDD